MRLDANASVRSRAPGCERRRREAHDHAGQAARVRGRNRASRPRGHGGARSPRSRRTGSVQRTQTSPPPARQPRRRSKRDARFRTVSERATMAAPDDCLESAPMFTGKRASSSGSRTSGRSPGRSRSASPTAAPSSRSRSRVSASRRTCASSRSRSRARSSPSSTSATTRRSTRVFAEVGDASAGSSTSSSTRSRSRQRRISRGASPTRRATGSGWPST